MSTPADIDRVLLVEDDLITSEITAQVLEKCEFQEVVCAENGHQALEYVRAAETPFGLVITDLKMPEMDGAEFLRHLADIDRSIPVILLSGSDIGLLTAAERLAQARQLNVLGALVKPVSCQQIKALLAKHRLKERVVDAANDVSAITEEELREGINSEQILLYYQPQVAMADERILSVEGLARWHHPERGLVMPGDFIALAEQCGMIGELTDYLCKRAMQDCLDWRAKGLDLVISLNFSVDIVNDLSLPSRLADMLSKAGLPASSFVLEVTESRITSDLANSLEVLTRLRMQGFGLSIDDFGTGYSSLQQLQQFPFTELKVDRAFVNGADQDQSARAIFESCVSLAQKLDLKVVAEGVENAIDLALARELNCQLVQGYYYSRPLPAENIPRFVSY